MVNTKNNFSLIIFIFYYICYFSGGVIRLLEETLQHPLHWFVCLVMKMNCLYVICSQKNMIKLLIRGAFQEKIGKLLALCENLHIAKFEQNAKFNLDIEPSHLSTDTM